VSNVACCFPSTAPSSDEQNTPCLMWKKLGQISSPM
jgi:hypothetical protein